jgi:pimeloyl-ACP methyl ester carboxylesterase
VTHAPDGTRLFVRVDGNGPGALVVPGVGADSEFEPLTMMRRVAFFDVRNRGRSDAVAAHGSVGVPVEVDDIDVVRARAGFETTAVLGWSYVGLIVALYAARYPHCVERVVMVCPTPPTAALNDSVPMSNAAAINRDLRELAATDLRDRDPVEYARAWRRIVTPRLMRDPSAFERLRSDPSIWPNEWPEHMVNALQRVAASHPTDYDYRQEAQSIIAPTLVVHGENDDISLEASREWVGAMPGARLLILPNVGHIPHAEAPEELFGAIRTFLDGDWPAGAARD